MDDSRIILVPLDLSPLGEVKLPVAEEEARAHGWELLLLHVLPTRAMDPTGAVTSPEARARTYLDGVTSRLRADGVRARGVIRTGPVAATIVAEAHEIGAAMIVLGTTMRSGLPRALLGSVADEVIRDATCPILLVRPDSAAPELKPVRSFDADAARVGPLSQRSLGLRGVDISRIIGSVGRAQSLGADFRPIVRTRSDDSRYEKIRDRMENGEPMPPVVLYKLGFGFYVLDGNHRVAAARALGQTEIDAEVTEFIVLGDAEAEQAFNERRAFEHATGITRVEAALPETYRRLIQLIDEYGGVTDLESRFEAARVWYSQVFRPMARRIRLHGLAERFPGERSADILVRIAELRRQAASETGGDIAWPDAVDMLAASVDSPRTARARLPE
ncbi:MAG: hypothetical protein FJ033_04810 [Chloroflexi bacterium]|nr:hypothetical protein [Chloroflexota bacterium]